MKKVRALRALTAAATTAVIIPAMASTSAFASTPKQQLAAVLASANEAPYVQCQVREVEDLSYAGQSMHVQMNMNMFEQHKGHAMDALVNIGVRAQGQQLNEKLYLHQGKEYLNQGSKWRYVGSVKVANLQQLSQMGSMVYTSVKEKSVKGTEAFTATLDSRMFSTMIQQALSSVSPASGAGALPKNAGSIVKTIFQNTQVLLDVTAKKEEGALRVSNEKVTMRLTITAKQMAELQNLSQSGNSNDTTVTKKVYGTGGSGSSTSGSALPKTPMKISAVETSSFTYNKVPVVAPKGLPKA